MEATISKPLDITGRDTHRIVAGLTKGKPAQFADLGDAVVIRAADIPAGGVIHGFKLRACCGTKVQGRHRYWPIQDWRSRKEWMDKRAEQHGFEILSVHVDARMAKIEKNGRTFSVDDTTFIGFLRVTDSLKFDAALAGGIGNKAKAYGFGMLRIS